LPAPLRPTSCAHGTIYAGDNQILNNHVHDVMNVLHDGGPIYTNGGQGNGDGSTTSVLAGNFVEVVNNTNNHLYQDEGSSYWNTYNNVTRGGTGAWIGMWTPTIHDNYADTTYYLNKGTNITFNQATFVWGGNWPSAAQAIIAAAGPDAAYQPLTGRIDDDDTAISYTGGGWTANGNRGFGDYEDAVHTTQTNGDTASLTFTGTGISVIGEKNTDQGQAEIFIDGTSKGLIDTSATTRQTQAVIYSTSGLSTGSHTIQFVKRSGTWATLDGFQVTSVHNDTNSSIAYTGTSWISSTNRGLGDYMTTSRPPRPTATRSPSPSPAPAPAPAPAPGSASSPRPTPTRAPSRSPSTAPPRAPSTHPPRAARPSRPCTPSAACRLDGTPSPSPRQEAAGW
jgi:hypothetical protein